MSVRELACYDCHWFTFNPGHPGYSEVTPGSDMNFGCYKGIWDGSELSSEADFATKIVTATNCDEFEDRR